MDGDISREYERQKDYLEKSVAALKQRLQVRRGEKRREEARREEQREQREERSRGRRGRRGKEIRRDEKRESPPLWKCVVV